MNTPRRCRCCNTTENVSSDNMCDRCYLNNLATKNERITNYSHFVQSDITTDEWGDKIDENGFVIE